MLQDNYWQDWLSIVQWVWLCGIDRFIYNILRGKTFERKSYEIWCSLEIRPKKSQIIKYNLMEFALFIRQIYSIGSCGLKRVWGKMGPFVTIIKYAFHLSPNYSSQIISNDLYCRSWCMRTANWQSTGT